MWENKKKWDEALEVNSVQSKVKAEWFANVGNSERYIAQESALKIRPNAPIFNIIFVVIKFLPKGQSYVRGGYCS